MTTRTETALRVAFEAWFSGTEDYLPYLLTTEKDDPGGYKYLRVQASWEGWQAAMSHRMEVTEIETPRDLLQRSYYALESLWDQGYLNEAQRKLSVEIDDFLSAALGTVGEKQA